MAALLLPRRTIRTAFGNALGPERFSTVTDSNHTTNRFFLGY
ncbi:hypothetical protein [Janthinobacterium sp. BJB446]|nr:hypothetical protein [Janthinobacterium sp. BJB446]